MHPEALFFMGHVKKTFPDSFKHKTVLDVGSGDINGNNRHLFDDCEYTGNDVVDAPNVTVVSRTKDLPFPDESFDTIVSTECFEHDPEYADSLLKIYRMLKPNGLFAFTCATTGRAEHGTRRTSPENSYGRDEVDMMDYYKNLTATDINDVLDFKTKFSGCNTYYNRSSCDLYFMAIKSQGIAKPLNLPHPEVYPLQN